MKTRPVLAFGAALSTGALLMMGLRAPQPALSQGVPAPDRPGMASGPSMPPALIEQRQKQLRGFLEAHAVKDSKAQGALNGYFGDLQRARSEVFAANRALLMTLRTPNAASPGADKPASDAQVQEAVEAYQDALKKYEDARAEGEKDLAKSLGGEWTPRMRALLLGMGAIGEPSPIVPVWGAASFAGPVSQGDQDKKQREIERTGYIKNKKEMNELRLKKKEKEKEKNKQ